MIKRIILSIILMVAYQAVFSQEKTAVDYRAINTKLVKIGDSSVVKLSGDVFLFHNGAIISCDSAYRYSEKRIEALGNVIINQNSLFIYGDKVVYNGETDEAKVYSSLIKVVDSTTVMYTRNMRFNTNEKIGYFSGGATVQDGNNLMEAESGTYNTGTKVLVLDTKVAMENEEYVLKTKKLIYNQLEEKAFFNNLTNIWNVKGEYLQSDKGNYDKANKIYNFEKNSYILTKDQECWADSLIYFSNLNEVLLKKDIQLNDTVQRASTFGDYGYFWSKSKDVLMTKNPSMFTYDEVGRDSSFVRADTITVRPFVVRTNVPHLKDNITGPMGVLDSLSGTYDEKVALRDSLSNLVVDDKIGNTSSSVKVVDNLLDSITNKSVKKDIDESNVTTAKLKDIEDKKLIEKETKLKADSVVIDENAIKEVEIPTYIELYNKAELDAMSEKELSVANKLMKRDKKRFDREVRRYKKELRLIKQIVHEEAIADSIANSVVEKQDSVLEITDDIEIENIADSSDMIVRAYGDAKVFKEDMQSIADSLIVETVDSTNTSIGEPVAWNGLNQITAARIRSYVKNGALSRTRMFSNPIVAQFVGTNQYNQMKGDYMDALYENGEMNKLVVTGNSLTRFYRTEIDEETKVEDVVAFITSTSTNMIIDLDSSLVTQIKWIGETETFTYPLDKMVEDTRFVEGFAWFEALRPVKAEVFNRKVRLSVRSEKMKISKPSFGITKEIMSQRSKLIESGTWTDRSDKLKINKEELFQQSRDMRKLQK